MRPKKLKQSAANTRPESEQVNANKDNLLEFQRYQLAFIQHLRQPKLSPIPAKVSAKGMAIYTEIVFNNLLDSVSACFPIAQRVLDKRVWQKLVRDFFIHHQAQTPIFREIPQEFLKYLKVMPATNHLPIFLNQLAHYEWIELALSTSDAEIDSAAINLDGNLLECQPKLAAACALLQYDYPVHKISQKFKPSKLEATYLLVFRDAMDKVQFIELNTVTFRLLVSIRPIPY